MLPDRFWAKVDRSGECWVWTAYIGTHGYGMFTVTTGNPKLAHRIAYESEVGPIPSGLELDHLCRNRRCVNPSHLEAVPHAVNSRRGETGLYLKNRTQCPQGHPYNDANTYRTKEGGRTCRACRNVAVKAWATRKRVERGTVAKKDWTHCKNGHLFDTENTYRNPSTGRRSCRTCRKTNFSHWYTQHRKTAYAVN